VADLAVPHVVIRGQPHRCPVRLDDPPSLRSCLSRIVHVTEQSPVNGSDEPITLTHGPAVGGLRTRTFLRASSVGVSALWMQLKGSGAASPQPSSTTTATVLPLGSRGCAASSHGFPSSAGGLVAMRCDAIGWPSRRTKR